MKIFTASWCGPCQEYKKNLEGLDVEIIDVDEDTPQAIKYGVLQVPTTIIERGKGVIEKLVGVQSRATIETYLAMA